MAVYEIHRGIDRFVLCFDTPLKEISAYALASALVGLADAVREANAIVNPGYRVEVVVEALTDGSFKATVRTVFTSARNLFSLQALQAVIWGIVSTHIYETALKTENAPIITVTETLVAITMNGDKIIVPRDVYEAKCQEEKSGPFHAAIRKVFEAANSDRNIRGVGFTEDGRDKHPHPLVPREKFAMFLHRLSEDAPTREVIEKRKSRSHG